MGTGRLRELGWRSSTVASVVRLRPVVGLGLVGVASLLGLVATVLLGGSATVVVVVVPLAVGSAWLGAIYALTRRQQCPAGCLQPALEGLTTDRLLLRQPGRDDAAALMATVDDDMLRWNGWRAAEHRAFERRCRAPHLSLDAVSVLITDKTSGEVLGELGVPPHDRRRRACLVGWWLAPWARRQGYGTEALRAVLPALHAAGVREVMVGTMPANTAVRRICQRLGMIQANSVALRLPDRRTVSSVWYTHRAGDDPWHGTGTTNPRPAAASPPSSSTPIAHLDHPSRSTGPAVGALAGLFTVVAVVAALSAAALSLYREANDPTRPRAEEIGNLLASAPTVAPTTLIQVAQGQGAEVLEARDISPCDLDGTEVDCSTLLIRLEGTDGDWATASASDIVVTCYRYTLRNSPDDNQPTRTRCP